MVLYIGTIVVVNNTMERIGATLGEILFHPVVPALRRGVISGACVEITTFRRKSQFIDTLYNCYRYNGGRAPRKLTVVVR